MTEPKLPLDDLGQLAEQEMDEKREETGSEARARELYDVSTEPTVEIEEEQSTQEKR